jgi:hypothetical protein
VHTTGAPQGHPRLVLKLCVEYPRQTDELIVEPDDLPCGAVVAGLFIGVRFEAEKALLFLPESQIEVTREASRRFSAAGVPVVATLS